MLDDFDESVEFVEFLLLLLEPSPLEPAPLLVELFKLWLKLGRFALLERVIRVEPMNWTSSLVLGLGSSDEISMASLSSSEEMFTT